jgi:hypothetical protein
MIQTTSPKASSSLHAEATALVFAAKLVEQLNTSPVAFLTDNLILARDATSEKIN